MPESRLPGENWTVKGPKFGSEAGNQGVLRQENTSGFEICRRDISLAITCTYVPIRTCGFVTRPSHMALSTMKWYSVIDVNVIVSILDDPIATCIGKHFKMRG